MPSPFHGGRYQSRDSAVPPEGNTWRPAVVLLRELARFYAQQLVEKNHYHQSSIGTAFASAQHLPIIFVLDNAVRREARLIPVRDRRLFWRDGDSHQGLQERRLGSDFVRLAGRRPQVRSVSVGVRVERRVFASRDAAAVNTDAFSSCRPAHKPAPPLRPPGH
jgi:hypothetical protein